MDKLSDRVRPDVEAAPWVIDEIKQLEFKINALNYSMQLDEELIGMIQKIISRLNNRPEPKAEITGSALLRSPG